MEEHTGIWGRSKSGKSTCAKEILIPERRLVVVDVIDEYASVAPVAVRSRVELLKAIKRGWRDGYRVRWPMTRHDDPAEVLNLVASTVWDVQEPCKGQPGQFPGVTLMVEEMADTFPNTRAQNVFKQMCLKGRHYQIRLVGVAQRLADVQPAFRNACAVNYFLTMEDETDYQEAGKRLRPCGPEWLPKLRTLQPHEYICKRDGQAFYGRNGKKK